MIRRQDRYGRFEIYVPTYRTLLVYPEAKNEKERRI